MGGGLKSHESHHRRRFWGANPWANRRLERADRKADRLAGCRTGAMSGVCGLGAVSLQELDDEHRLSQKSDSGTGGALSGSACHCSSQSQAGVLISHANRPRASGLAQYVSQRASTVVGSLVVLCFRRSTQEFRAISSPKIAPKSFISGSLAIWYVVKLCLNIPRASRAYRACNQAVNAGSSIPSEPERRKPHGLRISCGKNTGTTSSAGSVHANGIFGSSFFGENPPICRAIRSIFRNCLMSAGGMVW